MFRTAALVPAFLALLALLPASARAQRQLSLEANPFHGTIGYGWTTSPGWLLGVEVGIGFPQIDLTLAPAGGSFLDFAHIGLFARSRPAGPLAFDGRFQLGLAELDGCSGCVPGAFAALSGGAFIGGRNVKVGPRLTAGFIKDNRDPATFVLNLTPVAVLFTYTW